MPGPKLFSGQSLLDLGDDFAEGLRIVHSQVGKHFAVDVDVGILELAHERRIGHAVLADACVDSLYPERAKFALLGFAIAVGILPSFFDGIFRDGPYIFAAAKVTFGVFEHFPPLLTRCRVVD